MEDIYIISSFQSSVNLSGNYAYDSANLLKLVACHFIKRSLSFSFFLGKFNKILGKFS